MTDPDYWRYWSNGVVLRPWGTVNLDWWDRCVSGGVGVLTAVGGGRLVEGVRLGGDKTEGGET